MAGRFRLPKPRKRASVSVMCSPRARQSTTFSGAGTAKKPTVEPKGGFVEAGLDGWGFEGFCLGEDAPVLPLGEGDFVVRFVLSILSISCDGACERTELAMSHSHSNSL